MAVGAHQHEFALVKRGDLRLGDRDDRHRHPALFCGFQERCGCGCVRAKNKERIGLAEEIERRAAVGEERVRRAMTGPCRRDIGSRIVGRGWRSVRPADRRALIAIAKMDAERVPFPAHDFAELAPDPLDAWLRLAGSSRADRHAGRPKASAADCRLPPRHFGRRPAGVRRYRNRGGRRRPSPRSWRQASRTDRRRRRYRCSCRSRPWATSRAPRRRQ